MSGKEKRNEVVYSGEYLLSSSPCATSRLAQMIPFPTRKVLSCIAYPQTYISNTVCIVDKLSLDRWRSLECGEPWNKRPITRSIASHFLSVSLPQPAFPFRSRISFFPDDTPLLGGESPDDDEDGLESDGIASGDSFTAVGTAICESHVPSSMITSPSWSTGHAGA